ncbi:glucose PTS transporter subunit IIA [Mycoplasmopsis lipofaciens]|uniref:glucose PTS transporter subunit IIA n=1 Tax=Mycoplasmopsis lipofaciens TaxID=114884 RepID=UPI000481D408|nr:glucose PTS transporter subunit IIA [Mycoplasmopsis lipofaciens]
MGFWTNLFKKNKTNKIDIEPRIYDIVEGFGGIDNIIGFNNCAVRLRYDVKNAKLVDEEKLKNAGAQEIIFIGNRHIQVKFGSESEELNIKIKKAEKILREQSALKQREVKKGNLLEENETQKEKISCSAKEQNIVYSPCSGTRIDLSDLSDPAFSFLGTGYAIRINEENQLNVYSPISGKVIMCYPTKHAFGIQNSCGLEILVHIGVDTIKLNGLGFTTNIKQDQEIKHGDLLATVDLNILKKENLSSDVIVIITDNEHKEKANKLLCGIEIEKANQEWFQVIK